MNKKTSLLIRRFGSDIGGKCNKYSHIHIILKLDKR